MPEKIKNIVVTGARGMLGRALSKELAADGGFTGIDIEEADITEKEEIKKRICGLHPDIVIHTAAYTDVDGCEKNKELCIKVNAEGTENVASACAVCRARLVYISTDFVFNGEKGAPYTEEDPPCPVNTYGRSKLEGEERIKGILEDFLIIRTSWLFGHNGKNFVDTILRLAQERDELKIVDDQRGCPTYAADLARAVSIAAKTKATGIVHINNSGSCTWYEFAKDILSAGGIKTMIRPVRSLEFPLPAKRPAYSVMDTGRFEKITGRKMRPWKDALKEYLKA